MKLLKLGSLDCAIYISLKLELNLTLHGNSTRAKRFGNSSFLLIVSVGQVPFALYIYAVIATTVETIIRYAKNV